MRKYLMPAAILASTIAVAAPAAAQWQRAPQGYGYGYGYQDQGQIRRLEARVMQLRQEIRQLDRRNILSDREANALENEARNVQQRVRQLAYNGLDRRESYQVERQIAQLEQRIRYEAQDGNRYPGRGGYNDNRDHRYGSFDRDHDGRDDRYEDDHGRERDD